MVHCCARSRITLAVCVIAVLAVGLVARPHYALAQEPTPSPGAQADTVVVKDDPFPWADLLAGIGTVGLAVAAVYAAFVSLRQHLEQRRRQTDLDLAKLHGDVVLLLRQGCERAKGSPDEQVRREELEKAEDIYEGILLGMILARPELMKATREALTEYLKVATSEVESLRRRAE